MANITAEIIEDGEVYCDVKLRILMMRSNITICNIAIFSYYLENNCHTLFAEKYNKH